MMHGQSSTSNSFADTVHLDHGPNTNNPASVQHNVAPPLDASVHGGRPVIGLTGQSSSSVDTLSQLSEEEILAEFGWPPPFGAPTRTNQISEERRSDPNSVLFPESNGQDTNGQSMLQTSSSGALPHTVDLNASYEGYGMDINQLMETGLSLNPFTPYGFECDDQNPFAISPSNPLLISSGIAGYELEETNSREDLSSDGRRQACKRRAPEDGLGQLALGESSNSAQEAGNSDVQVIQTPLNINPPIASHPQQLGTTPGDGSDLNQSSNESAELENSQRNIRVRRSASVQNFGPASMPSAVTSRNPHFQSLNQSTLFYPFNRFPNSNSAAVPVNATPDGFPNMSSTAVPVLYATPAVQPFVPDPISSQTPRLTSWIRVSPGVGVSSFSPIHHSGNASQQQENIVVVPENERANRTQNPSNMGFPNENTSFPGMVAPTSRNGPSSSVLQPSAPAWFPRHNLVEQHAERLTDIINRSVIASGGPNAGGAGSNRSLSPSASALLEMDISVRAGIARPSQMLPRSGLMPRAERQVGGSPDIPPALPPMTAAQRRSRLVSEVRNALALVRRDGTIRFEDVMFIDHSMLIDVPEEPDIHEDMRLDVDNMSYEELLALEEHIGNVSTGLGEEAILAHLRRRIYQSIAIGTQAEDEPCCICQEEYVGGDDLGKVDCGHDFHFDCIKQWLLQKNICPICKMTALEF